jgi:hypothetical protein
MAPAVAGAAWGIGKMIESICNSII